MTRSIILAQCACAFALGMVSATPAKAITCDPCETVTAFQLVGYTADKKEAYVLDYDLTREDCESELVSRNLWKLYGALRFNVVSYACEIDR